MLHTPARASTAKFSQDAAQRQLQEAQLDIERKRHRKQAFAYEELCLSHFGVRGLWEPGPVYCPSPG